MWYMKLQFLFNNISISLIFLFDPASSVNDKAIILAQAAKDYMRMHVAYGNVFPLTDAIAYRSHNLCLGCYQMGFSINTSASKGFRRGCSL